MDGILLVLSLYLVKDVGVLKFKTLLMAVVICLLGPAARDIPLLKSKLRLVKRAVRRVFVNLL